MSIGITDWPRHGAVTVPWRSRARVPRDDRMLRSITAALPPSIADAAYGDPTGADARLVDRATAALRTLDRAHGARLGALGRLLVRTESVASSRIEHLHASAADYTRATVGVRANSTATEMVRATDALRGLIAASDDGITETAVLAAHRTLMAADPTDGPYAGRWRTVQNWIGGGASPRLATHVPPPPELVPDAVQDLLAFLARDDLPPIPQAAIAHAQFESIHPFTDGNGRIGRALIGAALRRRGVATSVVAPVASVLAADRSGYFAALDAYRGGDVRPVVALVARAVGIASDEAAMTALALDDLVTEWSARSAGIPAPIRAALVDRLVADPVLRLDDVCRAARCGVERARVLVSVLVADGTLVPCTDRVRDPVWCAPELIDEFDALDRRIGLAASPSPDQLAPRRAA